MEPFRWTQRKAMSRESRGSLGRGALVALLFAVTGPALAEDGTGTVQCYNEALGTVQETLAGDCKGRVVGEDQANEIRKNRRDYIQRVLTEPSNNKLEGRHLAGLGSGFFVAEDGSVVTSHHVVDGCAAVSIAPTFGEMILASAVVSDMENDLALLRSGVVPPAVAPLADPDDVNFLGSGFVVGYPNRGLVAVQPILSAVEILQQESQTPLGPGIVIRGDVRQGNSGGPLLDSGGSVVGIVFSKVNSVNVYKVTGELVRYIGFAVPTKIIARFLAANDVAYRAGERRPPQPEDRILNDARPYIAQIGCWN